MHGFTIRTILVLVVLLPTETFVLITVHQSFVLVLDCGVVNQEVWQGVCRFTVYGTSLTTPMWPFVRMVVGSVDGFIFCSHHTIGCPPIIWAVLCSLSGVFLLVS